MTARWQFRCFGADQRGAALVEFTLALPFIIAFVAGLSEIGNAMHQQHIVQKAVRDAARYAARTPFALSSCPLASQPEWAALTADTKYVALHGGLGASTPLLIPTWTGSRGIDVQISESCFNPASVTPNIFSTAGAGADIPVIKVEASAQFAGIGFLSAIGLSAFEIRAEHSEIWTGL